MAKTINKDNIASEIADELGISKSQSIDIVNDIIDTMIDLIDQDEKIRIPYFGCFNRHKKNARTGRNPKTKQEFAIPAREVVTFKATESFKNYINDNIEITNSEIDQPA